MRVTHRYSLQAKPKDNKSINPPAPLLFDPDSNFSPHFFSLYIFMTGNSAYITLLTSEDYVPGALTLALTLKRELQTKYKVAVLLDSSNITEDSLHLIKETFDDVIYVNDKTISSPLERVVKKLGRQELAITFTKILLWNQTKYDQLIYLDADTLPLKSLDHLFDQYSYITPSQVVASPDIGWPDIFNSGVLALKPDSAVFEELLAYSESTVEASFDGADQGLLNEFFHLRVPSGSNWIRLPFVYNVTPSDNYQYIPALTRFFSQINLIHFIGSHKPWNDKTGASPEDKGSFSKLWWQKFNLFFKDENVRIKLLNLSRFKGEAHKLNFSKLTNHWSKTDDVPLDIEKLALSDEPAAAKIFPWEERGDQRPPTRVFYATSYEDELSPEVKKISKVGASWGDNIETSANRSPPAPESSSSLKNTYKFSSDQASFNPDKSLDEISKLPIKLLTKKRELEKAKK